MIARRDEAPWRCNETRCMGAWTAAPGRSQSKNHTRRPPTESIALRRSRNSQSENHRRKAFDKRFKRDPNVVA